MNLERLLHPKSVAIIGASRDKAKIGNVILHKLQKGGFKGEIFPVNPNASKINGLISYKSLLDIASVPDLVVIVIPAAFIKETLLDCGMKGVKNVCIISAGFSEVGQAGELLEDELKEIANQFKLNIIGPNCLGFINTAINLDVTFAQTPARKGSIAFISQSGAMGTSFLDWAAERDIGVKYFISLGNKAVVDENDLLEEFAKDKTITSLLFYLEDFADGRRFYKLAKNISNKKTIVVLKPGKSKSAQNAMQSHTGSLAQSDEVISAALRDSGCIRAETVEELFNITEVLSWQPLPKSNKVAVITNAGGVGIQAVDDLSKFGLDVVPFNQQLATILEQDLPAEANVHNPVDVLGDALALRYKQALEKIIIDKQIDIILVLLTPQRVTQALETADYINKTADQHKKMVLASFVGGESVFAARKFLQQNKIPHFNFPNDAARAAGLIADYVERIKLFTKSKSESDLNEPTLINTNLVQYSGKDSVPLEIAQGLFKKFKLPILESRVFNLVDNVKEIAEQLEYPVVLKLTHPKLIHKTEFRAVRLNIESANDLIENTRELDSIAKSNHFEGHRFEIQPFLQDKIELIIGVNKDPDLYRDIKGKKVIKSRGFGHVIIAGGGGIYTEIYKDTVLKLLPLDENFAIEMLGQSKVGKILKGARGKAYDFDGVVKFLVGISELINKNSNIKSLDINPLFVTKNKVYAADIKMFV